MLKHPLFIRLFIIIAIIASLHMLAFQFYLYWRLWWLDSLMHFMSGLWISVSFLWFYSEIGRINEGRNKRNTHLVVAVLSSLLIGIGWEIFEYSTGAVFINAPNYVSDTITDISFDLIGGIAGYCYFIYKGYHNHNKGLCCEDNNKKI